jgi:hypothetical protein
VKTKKKESWEEKAQFDIALILAGFSMQNHLDHLNKKKKYDMRPTAKEIMKVVKSLLSASKKEVYDIALDEVEKFLDFKPQFGDRASALIFTKEDWNELRAKIKSLRNQI